VLPLSKKFKIPLIAAPRDFGLICPQKTLLNKNNICNKPFQTECITCGKTTYSLLKSFITYLGVRINSKNLKNVDKFIFGNEYAKKIWQQHLGLDDADVVVIPSYYDPPNSRKREGDKDIELPDDFILYIGALIPQKGINILIEAYRKLAVKTKLVLIGGAYRNYSYRSDENILVLQNMPRQTVMNAISRCKFAIFPMQFPSAAGPMSPLEVMGQKKAIIATNLESVREVIINGETGMLVPPNDTDKLAAAMSYLLERPEIASVMGEKGYTILMNKYLPDIVIPEIIREYQNLVPGYSTKFNMDSII
jgi:glycosyltransferase involved in cell wall biosynthesis